VSYQTQPLQKEQVSHIESSTSVSFLHDRIGIVLALFSLYIIWGSTYLGMRFALEGFPPFIMAAVRFLIAGSLLYAFLRIRGTPAPNRYQWAGSALVGALLLGGGNGGVAFAEQWVASGLAAVGIAAVPLWTALFIGLMGRWPTRLEWLGLGLGFLGVLLLNLEQGFWVAPLGAIAMLLAPVCWALGTALSTRFKLPSGLMSSAAQMIAGGLILLIISQVLGEKMTHFPSAGSLWAMGFLIVFGSLVAFCSYGYLLRRVRPALATSYAYVNPMVAVGLGVWLAGEHITLIGILAMLVILSGVGLVSLAREKQK
jgi:drug/metabolite transporter (DMT)-like permease